MRTERNDSKASCVLPTREFLKSSSLHGVKYLTAEPDRHSCERLMWLAFVVTGVAATLVIIASLWEKFQTSPTITGLDVDFREWDVPFPAVTLCPNDTVSPQRLVIFLNESFAQEEGDGRGRNFTKETLSAVARLKISDLDSLQGFSDIPLLYISLQELVLKVSMTCEQLLGGCSWKEMSVNCCDYFHPVFTEHGFCYTFNSIYAMRPGMDVKTVKPEYIYETDPDWAISFESKVAAENPIRVFIHPWNERLAREFHPQHEWRGIVKSLAFSVKHTYTIDNTRQLSVRQRKCVFADEWNLVTAHEYSYSSCMIECRMKRALSFCGCVPHFSPVSVSFPYCRIPGLLCLVRYARELNDVRACQCELGCDHMVYELEKLSNTVLIPRGTLNVEFVSFPMIRYKREVLFGWVDLLVSFGGIAGLFLGFSLLSGVECFYYFTIRAVCACIYMKRQPSLVAQPKKKKKPKRHLVTKKVTPVLHAPEAFKPTRSELKHRKRPHNNYFIVRPYLP